MVLLGGEIQFPVIHTNLPPSHNSGGDELIVVVSNHSHTTLFGHALHRAYPATVGNWINDPCIEPLNNLLISHFFHP